MERLVEFIQNNLTLHLITRYNEDEELKEDEMIDLDDKINSLCM